MFQTIIILFFLLLPPIGYFATLNFFSVNIPFHDDYTVYLNFLNHFLTAENSSFYDLILSQHNEHRVVFSRVLALGVFYLKSGVDFRLIIILGNIALIGIGILFFYIVQKHTSLISLIPASIFFFQTQSWENTIWATGAIQNYYVLLFAFLSLYLFQSSGILHLLSSQILAVIACFTSGNGFLIFITMLIRETAGFFSEKTPKKHTKLLLSSFTFLLTSLLYFHDYHSPVTHPSLLSSLHDPFSLITYFFIFLGGYCCSPVLSFLTGIFSVAVFLILIFFNKSPKNILFYYLVFLLLNAFLAAFTRSSLGIFQALSPRYKIFSILIPVILYLMWILSHKISIKQIILGTFLALFFSLFSYWDALPYMEGRRYYLIEGLKAYIFHNGNLFGPPVSQQNQIMNDAIKNKIFIPDTKYLRSPS